MASNKQRFNGNFKNLGWGKRKDALNKPVTEKMSKDLNPSSSHKVSRPDPERIKNKKLGRDDSTKEESVDQLSSHRRPAGFSMKPDKIKDVLDDGESSSVKFLKFRRLPADEIEFRPEVQLELYQDYPIEDEGKKWNRLLGGKKSFKPNIPAKTLKKSPNVALSKFHYFSEMELETTQVPIHKEEKTKSSNKVSEFLVRTGFFLEKPQW